MPMARMLQSLQCWPWWKLKRKILMIPISNNYSIRHSRAALFHPMSSHHPPLTSCKKSTGIRRHETPGTKGKWRRSEGLCTRAVRGMGAGGQVSLDCLFGVVCHCSLAGTVDDAGRSWAWGYLF